MFSPSYKTIKQGREMAESGGLAQYVSDSIERYEKLNERFNYSVRLDSSFIQEQVTDLELRMSQGEKPRLAGTLVGIKDNINIQGQPTTCCSKILENFVSPFDATTVKNLRDAGAILFGKLNMDEFAMGSSTEHSINGVVRNPLDPSRVAGGSSGGSAAAVACGAVGVSLGSDTGGSIRQPAAFCGVYGFKPSYGRVSRYGLVAFGSSLDQVGPFATNAHDLKEIYEVIEGYDPRDSTSESFDEVESQVPKQIFTLSEKTLQGCDPVVVESYQKYCHELKKHFKIKAIDLDFLKDSIAIYYLVATAEASANLARYDGIRYGQRTKNKTQSLHELISHSRSEGLGSEVKRRILLGSFVLSSGYYDAFYGKAQKIRSHLKVKLSKILGPNGVLTLPTAPSPAFKIGEKTNDPLQMYLADLFTVFANLVGFPAVSMPLSERLLTQPLPVGMQLIAGHGQDQKLLNLCSQLEEYGVVGCQKG